MTNESTLPSRRRQEVLQRARHRQALIRQRSQDSVLDFEQKLFAEEEQHVPQLLLAYSRSPRLPEPPPQSAPPPKESLAPEALSEFERQHNALRLYIFEQFSAGMKSREIAAMIGLSSTKITRWYNQVKDQPAIARLWTPLLSETDIRAWRDSAPQAEKAAHREADRATVAERLEPLKATEPDTQKVNRQVASALRQEGWNLSRIARALDVSVSTVSRWKLPA